MNLNSRRRREILKEKMSKEKTNTKKALIIAALIVSLAAVIIITTSFVSAEFWTCVQNKQVINYCNNYKPSKTCAASNGCTYCMSQYNATADCYVHGVWPKCNQIPQVCSNSGGSGGNVTIDSEPPILAINSPLNGTIFNSRTILLNLDVNEKSDIYYTDLDTGRGRWTPVCNDCFDYDRTRSFKEGLNNLQFKARDVVGNTAFVNVSFFIDSSKPRILKTLPKNDFGSGDFMIQFKEKNPTNLLITYGDTNPGFNVHQLDIGNECQLDNNNGKYTCNTNIDLSAYDGKEIVYWANLTDVANTTVNSKKPTKVMVDTTFPVINDLNYTLVKRNFNLKLNITEQNFDETVFSYTDPSNGKLREGKVCSRLKNGICERKMSLKIGHYDMSVQVLDEAGNSVGQVVSFDVV